MFQLVPLLAVGVVILCVIQHALAAWYIVSGAFAVPAKAVFTSPPCKHAPDSKSLPVCRYFIYIKCCVCGVKSFSIRISTIVYVITLFIRKLLRFCVIFSSFLIIYIYFSSAVISFCWWTNCVHHHIYNKHDSAETF